MFRGEFFASRSQKPRRPEMSAPYVKGIEVTELFDNPTNHGFDAPVRARRRSSGRFAGGRAGNRSTLCSAKRTSSSPLRTRNSSRVVEIVSLAGRFMSASALVDIDVRVLLCKTSPSRCGSGRSGVARSVYIVGGKDAQ
jgi:hypothetical protein